MDGQFYNDLRAPFVIANVGAVTLASTNKALWTVAAVPAMGKDYWWAGKTVRLRAFGQCTSAATPGNMSFSVFYGTGADATGVNLAASAVQTWVANQTNISFFVDVTIRCITTGATGTLFCTGFATVGTAAVAAGTFLIPATAPAVSSSCDLTVASNILSLQGARSGSTAETMQIVDLQVIALN